MTTNNIKKGFTGARLDPEASSVKFASHEASATIVYVGVLSSLKSYAANFPATARFTVPESLRITTAQMYVNSVELTGAPGGTGRLTINASAPDVDNDGSGSSSNNVSWEVEWTLVERKLEDHPYFKELFTNATTLENIDKWRNIPPKYVNYKAQFKIPDDLEKPTTWTALTGKSLKFCQKLAKGTEAYTIQVPVVRRITQKSGSSSISSNKCGKRDTPPRFDNLAAVWLKTADSWAKNGLSRWEHREEWSGFDSLDEDLYPAN